MVSCRPVLLPAATAAAALTVVAVGLVLPAAARAADPSSLTAGGRLASGAALVSPGNRYRLTMQTDGNLVESRVGELGAVWNSRTPGHPGAGLLVQTDGNVVVRATNGQAIWSTGTRGAGVTFSVQDDGNVVVRSSAGRALFATGTIAQTPPTTGDVLRVGQTWTNSHAFYHSGSQEFQLGVLGGMLTLQQDAGVVSTGTWSAGTIAGVSTPTALTLQTTGDLVLTAAGRVQWHSGTAGSSAAYFTIQDDGNLVLRTSAGRAVWASTSGRAILAPGKTVASGGHLRDIDHAGAPAGDLAVQTDGNLVLRYGTQVVWSSGTRVAGSRLVMQTDGNAVVLAPSGAAVWLTGTAGHPGAYLLVGGVRDVQVAGPGGVLWERP